MNPAVIATLLRELAPGRLFYVEIDNVTTNFTVNQCPRFLTHNEGPFNSLTQDFLHCARLADYHLAPNNPEDN